MSQASSNESEQTPPLAVVPDAEQVEVVVEIQSPVIVDVVDIEQQQKQQQLDMQTVDASSEQEQPASTTVVVDDSNDRSEEDVDAVVAVVGNASGDDDDDDNEHDVDDAFGSLPREECVHTDTTLSSDDVAANEANDSVVETASGTAPDAAAAGSAIAAEYEAVADGSNDALESFATDMCGAQSTAADGDEGDAEGGSNAKPIAAVDGDVKMVEAAEAEPSVADVTSVGAEASTASDGVDVSAADACAPSSGESSTGADVVMEDSEQQTQCRSSKQDDATVAAAEEGERGNTHSAASDNDNHVQEHQHLGDEDAYNHADSSASYERHASDEYDPANPTGYEFTGGDHGQEEYDPENPAYDRENTAYDPENPAYDPENPAYDHDGGHDPSAPSSDGANGSTAHTDASAASKRKSPAESPELSSSSMTSSSQPPPVQRTAEREPKRARADSSSDKREDKKGLADAAWDRLKDFQTLGEFQINQVSRAAFASLGALPEFAQVSIIARFTRVPLKGVRDKNGQLMRIHHEYLKENPHVAGLQPVTALVANVSADLGLFDFGYAPPLPVTGMSAVPVPYQKDVASGRRGSSTAARSPTASRRTTSTTTAATGTEAAATPQAGDVDEFGRTINKKSASLPRVSESSDRSLRATDPRRGSTADVQQQQLAPASRTESVVAASKPFDPRRRVAGDASESVASVQDPRRAAASSDAASNTVPQTQPGDPRRRVALPSGPTASAPSASVPAVVAPTTPVAVTTAVVAPNELFATLPASVRAVLDAMVSEGRLRESISDSVVVRLTQVPEHVALKAVENFSNVDLSHIGNLHGFLVGIVNRVHEKAIAAERAAAAQTQAQTQAAAPAAALATPLASAGSSAVGTAGYGYESSAAPASVLADASDSTYNHALQYNTAAGLADQVHHGAPVAVAPIAAALQQPSSPALSVPLVAAATATTTAAVTGAAAAGAYQYAPPPPQHMINLLPLSVQQRVQNMAATGAITSIDELSDKCYEVLAQLSEQLANEALTRFLSANLSSVRNRSGFLLGVVKRCRQEYGFN